jgi:hypothetical protein
VRGLVLLVAFCIGGMIQAQNLDFGLQIGGGFYDGDLSHPDYSRNVANMHGAIGGVIRFEYFEGVVLRAGAIYTQVSADDANSPLDWQQARNLHFRSPIFEVNAMLELHPFKWMDRTKDLFFSPYVFAGVSHFSFNPQAQIDGEWVDLQPLGTEGQGMQGYEGAYDLQSLAIPMGLGVRFEITERLFVDFEYGARRTDTDYLDDISKNYVSVPELSEANGGLSARLGNKINAATGEKRGNPEVKDWYAVPVITVAYRFDLTEPGLFNNMRRTRGVGCPSF